ncbi:hypothetical protein V866_002841 [Kwoniella sp. B9012]
MQSQLLIHQVSVLPPHNIETGTLRIILDQIRYGVYPRPREGRISQKYRSCCEEKADEKKSTSSEQGTPAVQASSSNSPSLPEKYQSGNTAPLSVDNKDIFQPTSSYELISSRLLRLSPHVPKIALFPFPVIDIKKPGKKFKSHRPSLLKGAGDERFSFTSSALLTWPEGEKVARLGIFLGNEQGAEVGHTWAVAIVDVEGGKMMILYDPDANATLEIRGRNLFWDDLHTPQIAFLRRLKSTKNAKHGKLKVVRIFWGGTAELSNKNNDMCLENTLRWMEFCEDINDLKIDNLPITVDSLITSLLTH